MLGVICGVSWGCKSLHCLRIDCEVNEEGPLVWGHGVVVVDPAITDIKARDGSGRQRRKMAPLVMAPPRERRELRS